MSPWAMRKDYLAFSHCYFYVLIAGISPNVKRSTGGRGGYLATAYDKRHLGGMVHFEKCFTIELHFAPVFGNLFGVVQFAAGI